MSHVSGADRRNHDLNIDEYLEPTSTMQLHTAGREGAGGGLSGMAMHLSGELAAPYMRALSKKDETRRNKLEARQKSEACPSTNGNPAICNAQQPRQKIMESRVSFQCSKAILPPVSADNMAPLNVESPILQATQAHVSSEKMESKVLQIMAMGFERQNVMKAMQAAFMNPDRAVEYLLTGMEEKTTLTVSAPPGFSQPSALLQYTVGPSNARAGPLALTCDGVSCVGLEDGVSCLGRLSPTHDAVSCLGLVSSSLTAFVQKKDAPGCEVQGSGMYMSQDMALSALLELRSLRVCLTASPKQNPLFLQQKNDETIEKRDENSEEYTCSLAELSGEPAHGRKRVCKQSCPSENHALDTPLETHGSSDWMEMVMEGREGQLALSLLDPEFWIGLTEEEVTEHLAQARVLIRKKISGAGVFLGVITGVDSRTGKLTVEYYDGDAELLSLAQIVKHLPTPLNSHAADLMMRLQGEEGKWCAKRARYSSSSFSSPTSVVAAASEWPATTLNPHVSTLVVPGEGGRSGGITWLRGGMVWVRKGYTQGGVKFKNDLEMHDLEMEDMETVAATPLLHPAPRSISMHAAAPKTSRRIIRPAPRIRLAPRLVVQHDKDAASAAKLHVRRSKFMQSQPSLQPKVHSAAFKKMKRLKEPKDMPRFKEPVNKELVNKPVNKEPANHTMPVELKRARAVIKPDTVTTKATKRMSAKACSRPAASSASRPNKKLKRQHVHQHVQVYAGQAVKGGLEQRVNRVGCFETALLELEEAGGVLMDRVSADDMHERKMALNILSISVKKPCLFYEKLNNVLRLPQDKLDDDKLCSGVRETMRYLGLLPHALDSYGKNDWASKKFVFKDKVREDRLARALQHNHIHTHTQTHPPHTQQHTRKVHITWDKTSSKKPSHDTCDKTRSQKPSHSADASFRKDATGKDATDGGGDLLSVDAQGKYSASLTNASTSNASIWRQTLESKRTIKKRTNWTRQKKRSLSDRPPSNPEVSHVSGGGGEDDNDSEAGDRRDAGDTRDAREDDNDKDAGDTAPGDAGDTAPGDQGDTAPTARHSIHFKTTRTVKKDKVGGGCTMKKGSVSKKASVSKKGSVSKKDRVSNRASTQPEKRKKPAKICKGGSEKRVDRVRSFSTALYEIEQRGGVKIHRVSENTSQKRKMALNFDSIIITSRKIFIEKLNEALRLPHDTSNDNTRLCSGVRETMRYLGLLPKEMCPDGLFNWAGDEFFFNDTVREERLARAILTNVKGSRPGPSRK